MARIFFKGAYVCLKKLLFFPFILLYVQLASAQSFRDRIVADNRLSASNYTAYREPAAALAEAPDGYTPFYISHYGRHGSRYLIDRQQYERPLAVLERAGSAGMLTEKGKYALNVVRRMSRESYNRWGELTPLGARQHRGIAKRMAQRFPDVFASGASVDARSTVVIRCILSMENEMEELLRCFPKLAVTTDASRHDMYYMNCQDTMVKRLRNLPEVTEAYVNWKKKHLDNTAFMHRLFKPVYADTTTSGERFAADMFSLAGIAQNSDIGDSINLYSLFTADELYVHWQEHNVGWYLTYGPSAISKGRLPLSQANLVRNIVTEADRRLAAGQRGATMRFGHESVLLPLVCLLDVNGYGRQTACMDSLEDYDWICTDIFPMACNLQFIFYKPGNKPAADTKSDEWLVRVLLNEEDARMPVAPVSREARLAKRFGIKGSSSGLFYRWSDLREYMLARARL